jgi:hypothetical protein
MAFDPAPSSLFASWSEDGTTISVPIASITDLTAAEADGTTGDWRDVMARILDHVWDYRAGLATADQPAKFTITRNRRESGTSIVKRFVIDIFTDVDADSVTAE